MCGWKGIASKGITFQHHITASIILPFRVLFLHIIILFNSALLILLFPWFLRCPWLFILCTGIGILWSAHLHRTQSIQRLPILLGLIGSIPFHIINLLKQSLPIFLNGSQLILIFGFFWGKLLVLLLHSIVHLIFHLLNLIEILVSELLEHSFKGLNLLLSFFISFISLILTSRASWSWGLMARSVIATSWCDYKLSSWAQILDSWGLFAHRLFLFLSGGFWGLDLLDLLGLTLFLRLLLLLFFLKRFLGGIDNHFVLESSHASCISLLSSSFNSSAVISLAIILAFIIFFMLDLGLLLLILLLVLWLFGLLTGILDIFLRLWRSFRLREFLLLRDIWLLYLSLLLLLLGWWELLQLWALAISIGCGSATRSISWGNFLLKYRLTMVVDDKLFHHLAVSTKSLGMCSEIIYIIITLLKLILVMLLHFWESSFEKLKLFMSLWRILASTCWHNSLYIFFKSVDLSVALSKGILEILDLLLQSLSLLLIHWFAIFWGATRVGRGHLLLGLKCQKVVQSGSNSVKLCAEILWSGEIILVDKFSHVCFEGVELLLCVLGEVQVYVQLLDILLKLIIFLDLCIKLNLIVLDSLEFFDSPIEIVNF